MLTTTPTCSLYRMREGSKPICACGPRLGPLCISLCIVPAGSQDFEEFLALQPKKLRDNHSVDEIRMWFDAADLDKNGTLSIDEFFLCMSWRLEHGRLHGVGVAA